MGRDLRTVICEDASRSDMNLQPRLERWIEENRENMLRDIFTAITVRSVSRAPENGLPYGEGCAKMLDVMSRLAAGVGFPFQNHEYHCGTVELKNGGKDTIGIFTHVDIVEPGNGWRTDPFEPFLKDGYIFGRGSTDNKGPAVASLYVLKCLRDLHIPLRHNVLVYFGCDEEAGMQDIAQYLKYNEPPKLSLIPDARFSVCCGEKGIIDATFSMDLTGTGILEITAGSSKNVVPNLAEIHIDCSAREAAQIMARQELTTYFANGVAVIQAEGISGHAAFPEHTENAAYKLFHILSKISFNNPETNRVIQSLAALSQGYLGEGVNIQCEDQFFGPLTAVTGTARSQNKHLSVTMNIRYPISTDGDTIRKGLETFAAEHEMTLDIFKDDPPAYVAPDSQVAVMINDLCKEVLKEEFTPYSMGGGTYARKLPNAMACGPLNKYLQRPGGTQRGGGHQPDECICLESLENLIKIYVRAIARIDQMI